MPGQGNKRNKQDVTTIARIFPPRNGNTPMPPIRLSDSELDAVMAAARPLDVAMRDEFLRRVASELGRCGEIGRGVVHRICAEAQRAFFDPPDLSGPARNSKYG